jgi:phenylalanyl-tRNA synthetase beta chain
VKKYKALPRFPMVRRDVAFVVSSNVTAEAIEQCMKAGGSHLLHDVQVFDVYSGPNLPDGKKSVAFTLSLLSDEKTMMEQEIEAEMQRVVKRVEQQLGAELRSN